MKFRNLFLALLPLSLSGCPAEDDSHDHSHAVPSAFEDLMTYEDGMVVQTSEGNYNVALTLSGGRTVGVHTVTLEIEQDGRPADPGSKTVSFRAGMPSHGHETDDLPAEASEEAGVFIAEGLDLNMPGIWDLIAKIEGPDFEVEAVFTILIVN